MSDKNEVADVQKKSRLRSPNFPYIGLREAVEKLAVIYSKDKLSATSAGVMLNHLGYKQAHGSSRRVLSALKQYGLLEEKGDGQFKVSNTGYEILHLSENDSRRIELLREAASMPYIFQDVIEEYKGDLPSDPTIKSHLVLKRGFSPDGAVVLLRALRETIEFARISSAEYTQQEKEEAEEEAKAANKQSYIQNLPDDPYGFFSTLSQKPNMQSSDQVLPTAIPPNNLAHLAPQPPRVDESELFFKISRDSKARVVFTGDVTQEAIEKLRTHLEVSKDSYPLQAELEQEKRRKAEMAELASKNEAEAE